MVTRVANKRKEPYDVYIGRPSIFGNPYKISDWRVRGFIRYTREEVIKLYRQYFHIKLGEDPEFKRAVLALKGKVLGCYCKPLACHGDVIVEYLEGGK